jgi:transcriptional regulator with XRE-family HTH domain
MARARIRSVPEAFGEVLRDLREGAGLSQEELGHRAASGRTYVSELERGAKGPSLQMIFRLGSVLGVPSSEIVRRVERLTKGKPVG